MTQAIKLIVIAVTLGVGAESRCEAQVLETETARPIPSKTLTLGSAFEFQRSAEGRESAVPVAFEYGVTDRLGLLVEPVIATSIRPKMGRHASGGGDLEVTASYLVRSESENLPALALAGEVKFPTAEDRLIGTDQTDYSGYLIASRRFGGLDCHANLGYTIIGKPAGVDLRNIWSGAVAAEAILNEHWVLFGEVLGNTSSAPGTTGESPEGQSAVVPEATGGELVGTLGFGLHPTRSFLDSMSMSYDNNSAILIRPALTWTLH